MRKITVWFLFPIFLTAIIGFADIHVTNFGVLGTVQSNSGFAYRLKTDNGVGDPVLGTDAQIWVFDNDIDDLLQKQPNVTWTIVRSNNTVGGVQEINTPTEEIYPLSWIPKADLVQVDKDSYGFLWSSTPLTATDCNATKKPDWVKATVTIEYSKPTVPTNWILQQCAVTLEAKGKSGKTKIIYGDWSTLYQGNGVYTSLTPPNLPMDTKGKKIQPWSPKKGTGPMKGSKPTAIGVLTPDDGTPISTTPVTLPVGN